MSTQATVAEHRYSTLLQLLRTSEAIWNASRLFFARWDISPSQFNVLNLLHNRSDGLSQIELSRELITHRSNVTGLVDRLEKRGLVARRAVPNDRRAYQVRITRAGTNLLRRILPEYHSKANAALQSMSRGQLKQFSHHLTAIDAAANCIATQLNES